MPPRSPPRKLYLATVAGMVATVCHIAIYTNQPLVTSLFFEPLLTDVWFWMRGQLQPPEDVFIVGIGEETYAHLGIEKDQMIPRSKMAAILRQLARGKPRMVILDYNFWGEVKEPNETLELADAMALIPTAFGTNPTESSDLPPHPALKRAAQVGSDILPLDQGILPGDNKVRRFLPWGNDVPDELGLAALPARHAGKTKLPDQFALINYYGPKGTIPRKDAHEILKMSDEELRTTLQDRFVFLGVITSRDIPGIPRDHFLTPYSSARTFGVEIHATAAANMLNEHWIRRFSPDIEAPWVNLSTGLLSALIVLTAPQIASAIFFLSVSAWLAASYFAFTHHFFLPGLTAVIICSIVWILKTLAEAEQYRREATIATAALQLSMAPQVFAKIKRNALRVTREAEQHHIACLFADLEKFSSLSQTMSPYQHQQMINDFCDAAESLILENEGTLVTVYGDAFFAMWGAPLKCADPEAAALAVAIKLPELLKRVEESHGVAVRARIGISSGGSWVGNFGSRRRLHYSAYGEVVNTSSRLEALNKEYGSRTLVSKSVYERCHDRAGFVSMGKASLDTQRNPIEVFALFSSPIPPEALTSWSDGLTLFENKRFKVAADQFVKAASLDPQLARASQLLCFWAERFIADGTPPTWEGEIYFAKRLSPISDS